VAVLKRAEGQAAVEFFFVMLGVLMIMGLLVVLFTFAQTVFFETSRARADVLESFHAAKQFEVADDEYPLKKKISVALRPVPYLEKLITGAPKFERTLVLRGGTKPTIVGLWGGKTECLAAAALVLTQTPVHTGTAPWPGEKVGTVAAGIVCALYHKNEY